MKCGLLGRKLGHSYSPMIHEQLGDYSYDLFEKEPEEVEAFLHTGDFSGLNVTIPYKQTVLPFLDRLDDQARRLGNVNTIVKNSDGTLEGHNTDYFGFSELLRRSGLSVSGKKVLVLGTGGASLTVTAVLQDAGAEVVRISRTGENHYGNLGLHADARVIVNTTPVGMYPSVGQSPVDLRIFPRLEGVLDLIYNPARTQLLLDAERMGVPAFGGLRMLAAQAVQASAYFQHRACDLSVIDEIVRTLRFQMENIVLIGMAGCGKSTIGRLLAQETGRKFVDSDREIELLAGKTIPRIFSEDGEPAFRTLETTVLEQLGKESGLVIATGGGCVTRPENELLLRQNGILVWLQRDPALLETTGRPLSLQTDPGLLYKQRLPLYGAWEDCTVENSGTPEQTCCLIQQALKEVLQ